MAFPRNHGMLPNNSMPQSLFPILVVLLCSDLRISISGNVDFKYKMDRWLDACNSLSAAVLVECSSRDLKVIINRRLIPNFSPRAFHLTDRSCEEGLVNKTHVILPTDLNDCGTIKKTHGGAIMYANILHGYLKNRFSYMPSCNRKITCFIDETAALSVRNTTKLNGIYEQEQAHSAKSILSMRMFRMTKNGVHYLSSHPSTGIFKGEKLSFNTVLRNTTSTATRYLAIEECRTVHQTLSLPGDDKDIFIQNGCLKRGSPASYLFSPKSRQQTFSYAVSMKGNGTIVRCRFVLCSSNDIKSLCVTGCRHDGKKWESSQEETRDFGPFVITERPEKETLTTVPRPPSSLLLQITLTVALITLIILLIAGVFFYRRHRLRLRQTETFIDKEEKFPDIKTVEHSANDTPTVKYKEGDSRDMKPKEEDKQRLVAPGRHKIFLNMDWTTI